MIAGETQNPTKKNEEAGRLSAAPFDTVKNKDGVMISKSGNNYLTVCYEKLAPVFVEAIKDLNKQVSELKKENEILKNENQQIKTDIIKIKEVLNII